MSVCQNCRDGRCAKCETPSCTDGHRGSGRRPLTNAERVDYALGRITQTTMPTEPTPTPEPIRISSAIPATNGNGQHP